MSPLILLTILIAPVALAIAPFAAAFHWRMYREERAASRDARVVTFAGVLAAVVTVGMVAVELVAIPVGLFVLGAPLEVQRAGASLVLLGLDILLVVFIAPSVYLRLARRRSHP